MDQPDYDSVYEVYNIIGEGPYSAQFIRRLIEHLEYFITDDSGWDEAQTIVVGKELTPEDYEHLDETIEVARRGKFRHVYLSQEDFKDYFQHGTYANYQRKDARIRQHPGLAYLAKQDFKWPSLAIKRSSNPNPDFADSWRYEHELHSVYDYNVKSTTSIAARREALKKAIRPDALGLPVVAHHIAGQIRVKYNIPSQRDPVSRWIEDLAWLKGTYYANTRYSFIWPDLLG